MRRMLQILVGFCAVTVSLYASQTAPSSRGGQRGAAPPATGVVVGTVVDAGTGRPVPGAVVMIGAAPSIETLQAGTPPPTPRRLIANANGRFVVTAVPVGPLTLSVTAPGYLPGGHGQRRPGGPTRAVMMADGQREGPVTIQLWKPAAIEGRLVDEAGEPIVRASVRALRRTWNAGNATFVSSASTNTDDRGAFRIAGLVPGEWSVVVPATYDTTPASVSDEFMRATLRGGPAPQNLMSTIRNSGGPTPGTAGERVGQFVVASSASTSGIRISEDSRRVLVYPTLFYPALSPDGIEVVTLESGQELSGVELQSIPTATVAVSGQLLGPTGPAAHTGVRLVPVPLTRAVPETLFETARATTDVNGNFTILAVTPGEYELKASVIPRPELGGVTTVMTSGGGTTVTSTRMSAGAPEAPSEPTLWATGQVSVGNQDIAAISVTLRPGPRVTGTIEFTGAGTPPAPAQWQRASVSLRPLDGAPPSFVTAGRFDAEGRFKTMGYPPGRYVVTANPPAPGWYLQSAMLAGRDVSLEPLILEDADITDVVVTYSDRRTELSGMVTTPVGTNPDGIVIAFPSDLRGWTRNGMNARQTSAARVRSDGRYTITGLPAGEYLIAGVPSDVEVQAGNLEFYESLTSHAVRVTLAHGESRQIDVRIDAAREMPWSEEKVDEQGSGPFVPESQAGQMPPREQALPATGSGSISGVVTLDDDARTPVRRATVRLIGSSATSVSRLTGTDDQGRFAFRDLPPGRYNLVSNRLGYVTGSHGQSRPGSGQAAPVALAENQHVTDVQVRLGRGAVIAGRIVDEFGQPADRARVSLMQFRNVNGERILSTASGFGVAQTDDRGAYRMYGLSPGEYVVAVASPDTGGDLRRVSEAEIEWADRQSGQPPPPQGPTVGVAPTYFPGTADPAGAVLVRVNAGEERAGIDFVTQFVRTATVSGRIEMPDGTPPRTVQLSVVNEARVSNPFLLGSLFARTSPDGTFTSANVPPGKYTLLARASDGAPPAPPRATPAGARPAQPAMTLWAQQEVMVSGDDVSGVIVRLAPGMTISGRLTFDGATQTAPSSLAGYSVRVFSAATSGVTSGVPIAPVSEDGTFHVAGVAPGPYRLSVVIPRTGPLPTWSLRRIQHGEKDIAEAIFDVQAGVDMTGLDVVLTDRVTEVTGHVLDQQGRPVSDYSVIFLPTDEQLWQTGTRRRPPPQRPDTTGRFRAVDLPPGEYYMALVTDYEPDQLSDTTFLQSLVPAAIKITLAEGERKVQDVKLAGG